VKEKVTEGAQDCNGDGVLFQPYLPRTILLGGLVQQHTATAAASATLTCIGLPQHSGSGSNECSAFLEAQLTTSLKSVLSSYIKYSSLNNMFIVVVMVMRQIIMEEQSFH
jgi:hypothetical protein